MKTGLSAHKRDGLSHSRALRFGKIHLRTMSLYESGDFSGVVSLKDICDDKSIFKVTGDVSIRKLAYLLTLDMNLKADYNGIIKLNVIEWLLNK